MAETSDRSLHSETLLEKQDEIYANIQFLTGIKDHIHAGLNGDTDSLHSALKMVKTWLNELEEEYKAIKPGTE